MIGLITRPTASGRASLPVAERRRGPTGRRRAGQEGVLLLPVPDPARVEDHVAVDHLAGQRVGPQARHGIGHVGRDPAEGAVVDVLGVELVAPFLLPADRQGVADADLLERLVPLEDARLDERPVLVRDRALDVPDELLLGGRELGLVVRLLDPPAVDLADEVRVGVVRAEVLATRSGSGRRGRRRSGAGSPSSGSLARL